VFLLVKGVNKLRRADEPAPAGPTPDQALLTEIRDLLKSKA
jgi:large conductance mechanosensitive channel